MTYNYVRYANILANHPGFPWIIQGKSQLIPGSREFAKISGKICEFIPESDENSSFSCVDAPFAYLLAADPREL